MSNPAVTKLQKKKIGKYNVWLDDNIGEKMHLHINRFRADMDYENFSQLCRDLEVTINSLVDVDGFDASEMDPVFMEQLLCDERCLLHDLKEIREEKHKLSELWVGFKKIQRVNKSDYYRKLHSDKGSYRKKGSDHNSQTPKERMDSCRELVEQKGYPYAGQYIILYGDNNIIYDGQHRAVCLWELNGGDMEIPVQRYIFKGYRHKNEALLSSPFAGLYRTWHGFTDPDNSFGKIAGRWKERIAKIVYFPFRRKIKSFYYRMFFSRKLDEYKDLLEQ